MAIFRSVKLLETPKKTEKINQHGERFGFKLPDLWINTVSCLVNFVPLKNKICCISFKANFKT